MEHNIVVDMLDEEIARLQQVRSILESLVVVEARVAPLLSAAAEEPKAVQEESPEPVSAVVRHVSRRGIKTGQRGPRTRAVAPPRPLDAAVPQAPVVVSRSAIVARKPVAVTPPPPAPDGTLEAWVRSLKQDRPAA